MTPAELRAKINEGLSDITSGWSMAGGPQGIEAQLKITQDQLGLAYWAIGQLMTMLEAAPLHNHAPSAVNTERPE